MARTKEERRERSQRYRAANLEAIRAYDRARYKAHKGALKRYHANKEACKARNRKWKLENRDRRDAYRREWYLQNREWALEYAQKWAAANPEYRKQYNDKWRAENVELFREIRRQSKLKSYEKQRVYSANRSAWRRQAGGKHTVADIQRMYVDQAGLCAGCLVEFPQTGKHRFHIDHIMPLKLGGSNWPDNLQLLCRTCNCRKNAMHPDDWAKLLPSLRAKVS